MTKPILVASGLTKDFDRFRAVDGVDLQLDEGEICSVIGPNGAGKTTFFGLVSRTLRPTAGRLVFAGRDITRKPSHTVARLGIARSFQTTSVFPRLTVVESLAAAVLASRRSTLDFVSWRHLDAIRVAEELAGETGLSEVVNLESRALSHGDQRRLDIALAMASRPRLLLLDEPTAGMSPYETERTVELVKRLADVHSLTVLLSEHDTRVVMDVSDRIVVLHQGRVIADGTPEVVARDSRVAEVYFGEVPV